MSIHAYDDGRKPLLMGIAMLSPVIAAELKARIDFYGRDRRRVKREVRKAISSLSVQAKTTAPVSREPSPFWRNRAAA